MDIDYSVKFPVKRIKRRSPAGRFLEKVLVSQILFYQDTPCWEWQACIDDGGYGRFNLEGIHYAHTASYYLFVGTVPEGKEIDHLCRRRHCVNPLHLQAVTHKINMARMAEIKATCKNDHVFTPENTFAMKSGRGCKTCRYQKIKEWRARHPQKAREINTASKKTWRKLQVESGRTGRF